MASGRGRKSRARSARSALADLRRDLILNGDVKPRRAAILRGEEAGKMIGEAGADSKQTRAVDPERDAGSKRIDSREMSNGRCRVGSDPPDQLLELIEGGGRELVE